MAWFGWGKKSSKKDAGPAAPEDRPETAQERLARLVRPARREERMLVEFARELLRGGEVAWDLGPERGFFTAAAAILVGHSGAVTAVEPRHKQAAALRDVAENLGRNAAKVEVIETGLGERIVPGESRTALPRQVNFEWLIRQLRRPHVVRIAAGVGDQKLWSGAERLMGEIRPILLFEVQPVLAHSLGLRLRHHGYELFDAEKNPSDRLKLIEPVRHTLALPVTTARDEDREV
jgi:precorrin-6B methylase 2